MKKLDVFGCLETAVRFFSLGEIRTVSVSSKGLVNLTFFVETDRGRFVLQRMSQIFDERVVVDQLIVTEFLKSCDFIVPTLLCSKEGWYVMKTGSDIWRASEYIEHDTEAKPTAEHIESAAGLLGSFHRVMQGCEHTPVFSIPDFHETRAIVQRLDDRYRDKATLFFPDIVEPVAELKDFIVKEVAQYYLPETFKPKLIHGDPKFDNFLFRDGKAVALIDFDTIMRAPNLVDLGDGMRSLCRKNLTEFDGEIFERAVLAYNTETLDRVTLEEARGATCLLTLELAARFLIDCFDESYFVWDKSKYSRASEHNLVRAKWLVEYYRNIVSA